MRYILFSFCVIFNISNSLAQTNCHKDPSCKHTKQMMWESVRQWDSLYVGIDHNKRSDSIDILHYTVNLDMSDMVGERISGNCVVRFQSKIVGLRILPLDLLQMKVDSVKMLNQILNFFYNDTLLQIALPTRIEQGSINELTVYYQGIPQRDRTWGGFYYKDGYAYNLGVGFASDPHNYGRVWHPCFDNFKERSTYTFQIKTRNGKKAHCNGYLESEHNLDGVCTRIWQMKDAIPTYLACIAVADYTTVLDTFQGVKGIVPIEIAAHPNDTSKLRVSFKNLQKAIATYEYWYGPHRWNKVGYSLVPFKSGAMEHATNITFPIYAADGSMDKEYLMAHELGHSWWGNLVTCETAADMWINEGMASYSEDLFWEYTYGWKRYIEDVKKNHYYVLLNAHEQEGGYRPISGVPHEYTYGTHVYDKGASVMHNMRWYMGDEAFRKGLHYITDNYQFKNLTTPGYRDAMSIATGMDMNPFFDDWIFRGGFPHFEIDHYKVDKEEDGYDVKIYIRQKLLGRSVFCTQVPLQISFFDENWKEHQEIILVSNELDSAVVEVSFKPHAIILNKEHRLNQARIDYQIKLNDGRDTLQEKIEIDIPELALNDLKINDISDSAWLHLEHHLVEPTNKRFLQDVIVTTGLPTEQGVLPFLYSQAANAISKTNFWTINGLIPNNLDAELTLNFKEKGNKFGGEVTRADSLVLFYRPDASKPWRMHPACTKTSGTNAADFTFSLLKGDYILGKMANIPSDIFTSTGLSKIQITQKEKEIHVALTGASQKATAYLYNQESHCVFTKAISISTKSKSFIIPTQGLAKGIYFVKIVNSKGKLLGMKRVVVV